MISASPTPDVFDRWATVYDDERNPFCALEARLLDSLLPSLKGKIILDAGCGTGRHFNLLVHKGVSSLHGVDYSEQMLEMASRRLPQNGKLHLSDCSTIPLPDQSVDIVVCSFVLGYVQDLHAFCREMKRLLRPEGQLFLADIHPGTADKFAWKRSFHAEREEVSIQWNHRNISCIRALFQQEAFHLQSEFEVPFSEPERPIFVDRGRVDSFEKIRNDPALCIFQFAHEPPAAEYSFSGAQCAITADLGLQLTVGIYDGKISFLRHKNPPDATQLSLDGYMFLPGLINAHDHLDFSLFPKLGAGPYEDTKAWADDIHSRYSDQIALHRMVPHDVRVRWGAIRNLLCGVTTVCHHNPISTGMLNPGFPVRVVDRMRWIHSPAFDPEGLKAQENVQSDIPFILHAGEGLSESAVMELRDLHRLGLMRSGTILVHGLAITRHDIEALRNSGVGLIFCPSSNEFLFGEVPLHGLVTGFELAAIGSDSPLTACGDLLDEAAYATSRYNLPAEKLYAMLTTSPAAMLRLSHDFGQIHTGGTADLIAVKDCGLSPAQTLQALSWKGVHLVIRAGVIRMASHELLHIIPEEDRAQFTCFAVDDEFRWIRGSFHDDFEATAIVQDNGKLRLGRRAISLA